MFIFEWLYEFVTTSKYDMSIAIAARGFVALFLIGLVIVIICALIAKILIHYKERK